MKKFLFFFLSIYLLSSYAIPDPANSQISFPNVLYQHFQIMNKSSIERLDTLDPGFRGLISDMINHMEKLGYNALIPADGATRTIEDQRRLFSTKIDGKRVTQTMESDHLTGFAVDVYFSKNHKLLLIDPEAQKIAADYISKFGVSWGGNWVQYDTPHFYIKNKTNTRPVVSKSRNPSLSTRKSKSALSQSINLPYFSTVIDSNKYNIADDFSVYRGHIKLSDDGGIITYCDDYSCIIVDDFQGPLIGANSMDTASANYYFVRLCLKHSITPSALVKIVAVETANSFLFSTTNKIDCYGFFQFHPVTLQELGFARSSKLGGQVQIQTYDKYISKSDKLLSNLKIYKEEPSEQYVHLVCFQFEPSSYISHKGSFTDFKFLDKTVKNNPYYFPSGEGTYRTFRARCTEIYGGSNFASSSNILETNDVVYSSVLPSTLDGSLDYNARLGLSYNDYFDTLFN